jgi:hypothetical protein
MNIAAIYPIPLSTRNPQVLLKDALTILISSIGSININLATILLSIDYIKLKEATYTYWVKIILITLGRGGILKVLGV